MKSGEIKNRKVYVSPRPPPTISYKDHWMEEMDSEVDGSSKDAQRIQPKPKTQLSRTARPVGGQESTKEIEKGILFDHEDKLSTRTGRPVKVEEHDIDLRVPGLSRAVVGEAEHLRVQALVKKIEHHPHREALHADLQQNNVYSPFSNNTKAMIREFGNVELFELCESTPKV